jgi:hypothetical protein
MPKSGFSIYQTGFKTVGIKKTHFSTPLLITWCQEKRHEVWIEGCLKVHLHGYSQPVPSVCFSLVFYLTLLPYTLVHTVMFGLLALWFSLCDNWSQTVGQLSVGIVLILQLISWSCLCFYGLHESTAMEAKSGEHMQQKSKMPWVKGLACQRFGFYNAYIHSSDYTDQYSLF